MVMETQLVSKHDFSEICAKISDLVCNALKTGVMMLKFWNYQYRIKLHFKIYH